MVIAGGSPTECIRRRVNSQLVALEKKANNATVAEVQMKNGREEGFKKEKNMAHRRAQGRSSSGAIVREQSTRYDLGTASKTPAALESEESVRKDAKRPEASNSTVKRGSKAVEKTGASEAALSQKYRIEKTADDTSPARPQQSKEQWQVQKAALEKKFGEEGWNPRKKLSPDAIEGIRAMHAKYPGQFTTSVLAKQFEVSPEAIRRILKSKWKPTPEEAEKRRERWDRRGEKIWTNLAEMGQRPPKKWREMGVGRAKPGEAPKWSREHKKSRHPKNIYTTPEEKEDIIATRPGAKSDISPNVPRESFADRIL